MAILRGFFLLLVFQFLGTLVKAVTGAPLPGPVFGMILLALWLTLRRNHTDAALSRTADGLLGWLGLLFVPAGTGVVANLTMLRSAWLPISVALLCSTVLTVLVTAWVMSTLQQRRDAKAAA